MNIRTLHIGLGPIGIAVAQQIAQRPGFEIVGAVDIAPAKIGQDCGAVLGLSQPLNVLVHSSISAAINTARPDVAILCTSSQLSRVVPQLEELCAAGIPVVSTTEELTYPVGANKKLADQLDAAARETGIALLATGVNPGFAMDALPIALTSVCSRVEKIEIHRVQDARTRRLPFQQKIGAGLSPELFQQKVASGSVRHVGLTESVTMIADAMNWELERVSDEIAPKIAPRQVSSDFLTVPQGEVCGLIQKGIGYVAGEAKIVLHMEAYLGAPKSYERVHLHSDPPIEMTINGGIAGDVATASMIVNSIPKVLAAPPGLHTMRDMPLPSFYNGAAS